MGLTPLDIHNKEFRRGFRGYSEPEVDEFLDEVVREFESLLKENAALRDQAELMSSRLEQYRQMEDTLHKTLIVAQESADELKASARKEAETISRQAQLEAERTRHEVAREVEQARDRIKQLAGEFVKFKATLKGILRAQIELLDEAGRLAPVAGPLPGDQEPDRAGGGVDDDTVADEPSTGEPVDRPRWGSGQPLTQDQLPEH